MKNKGLTLNGEKSKFNQTGVALFSLKVEALRRAPAPASAAEIRSLLGMATFSASVTIRAPSHKQHMYTI